MRSPGRQRRVPESEYRLLVGQRVRALREQAPRSQQALADDVDMSVRYLGSLERGTANVSLDVLVRLADGLGVQPRDFLPERDASLR
jgi:XRE family aerobic/anaerobic benzoate catabolism transcriptional regulator